MPARSIAKRQANYLKTVHLDQIGEERQEFTLQLDEVESALLSLAGLLKAMAEANLSAKDAIDTGKLAESIQFEQVEYLGGTYSLDIKILDYYDFVNKGVHGFSSSYLSAARSPYKYKNLGVSKAFVTSLRKWLIRHGLKSNSKAVRAKGGKYALGTERKTLGFENTSNAMAYAIAVSIKKKGLKATHFWDDALEEVQRIMPEVLGDAFAISIVNTIAGKK